MLFLIENVTRRNILYNGNAHAYFSIVNRAAYNVNTRNGLPTLIQATAW